MPQLKFKGLKIEEVKNLSSTLSVKLGEIMDTESDWFLFEHVNTTTFVNGIELKGSIMIDIYWFDRGQEIKNQSAKAIHNTILNLGYENIEIVFHELKANDYFENGEHY